LSHNKGVQFSLSKVACRCKFAHPWFTGTEEVLPLAYTGNWSDHEEQCYHYHLSRICINK